MERVVLRDYGDPTGNGLGLGAVIGAGAALTMMSVMFARCDAGGPSPGPTYTAAAVFGAGIGAAVGWTVDRLHRGSHVIFPIVSREPKGVGVVLQF